MEEEKFTIIQENKSINNQIKSLSEDKINDILDNNNNNSLEEPLVLKIIIEKEKDIKDTISLLKKEIVVVSSSATTSEISSDENTKKDSIISEMIPNKTEFQGFSNLLADNKVKKIIKSIAGEDTEKLIDNTMNDVNSKKSVDEKHKALTTGIKKLQTNLKEGSSVNMNDPTLNLALSLLGLKKEKLI